MTQQNSSNLYSQGFGTTSSASINSAVIQNRAPASTDVKGSAGVYPIGQRWIDQSANASYTLTSLATSSGVITATWAIDGGGSGTLSTLSGDTGTATPSAGNIQIAGGSGVSTSASGAVVTISLTGGGTAIDSFVPDAGTNPVVPTALGAVTMAGTANQITTTGGTNSLTFSTPSTFIAPGSIAATTTLTATLGNITATNGNFVFGTAGNKDIYTSLATTTTAGANSAGTVTLVGGTATISTTAVTANSKIRLYRQSVGATGAAATGNLSIGPITPGTSFVIGSVTAADATALAVTDVSVVFWEIVN